MVVLDRRGGRGLQVGFANCCGGRGGKRRLGLLTAGRSVLSKQPFGK